MYGEIFEKIRNEAVKRTLKPSTADAWGITYVFQRFP